MLKSFSSFGGGGGVRRRRGVRYGVLYVRCNCT